MNKLKFKTITDYEINKYLDYRNLDINLENSVSNKKIKKIDHYVWWLRNIDRKSYIVKRGNTDLIVLYHTINFLKKKKFIFPGYFICGNKFSISELLSSIKWQNATLDKISGDKTCAIIVPKDNLFSNAHSKYFKYKILDENNKLYKKLKKIKSFNKKFNIYTR
ncbi:hypothetical protein OAP78_02565 [Candidatus Pelagibacter sp.]|nr:hypothetical protein [Candidatus Pelagibacter sp.]